MPVTGATLPELFPLYYERKLLEYIKANLVATKYGQKFSMPVHSGRTAVWTRFQPLNPATTPITFQPTPTTGASMATQQVQATIEEYANYIELDEFTDITSFVPLVDQATDLLSYNAQMSLDAIAMAELTSGTNVLYADGVSGRSALDGTKKLSKSDIRKAINILKRNNIPPFPDGYYVVLIHPDKTLDLFTDTELIQLAIASKDIFEKGVVGQYGGAKFVESTTLPILAGAGGGSPAADVYQTVVLGMNAYGVVDIDGKSVQMVFTNVDKLGRVKTIGWKAYFACKRLYEPALVRIESN
jgi:N4-gp56 family major capsid protein